MGMSAIPGSQEVSSWCLSDRIGNDKYTRTTSPPTAAFICHACSSSRLHTPEMQMGPPPGLNLVLMAMSSGLVQGFVDMDVLLHALYMSVRSSRVCSSVCSTENMSMSTHGNFCTEYMLNVFFSASRGVVAVSECMSTAIRG